MHPNWKSWFEREKVTNLLIKLPLIDFLIMIYRDKLVATFRYPAALFRPILLFQPYNSNWFAARNIWQWLIKT